MLDAYRNLVLTPGELGRSLLACMLELGLREQEGTLLRLLLGREELDDAQRQRIRDSCLPGVLVDLIKNGALSEAELLELAEQGNETIVLALTEHAATPPVCLNVISEHANRSSVHMALLLHPRVEAALACRTLETLAKQYPRVVLDLLGNDFDADLDEVRPEWPRALELTTPVHDTVARLLLSGLNFDNSALTAIGQLPGVGANTHAQVVGKRLDAGSDLDLVEELRDLLGAPGAGPGSFTLVHESLRARAASGATPGRGEQQLLAQLVRAQLLDDPSAVFTGEDLRDRLEAASADQLAGLVPEIAALTEAARPPLVAQLLERVDLPLDAASALQASYLLRDAREALRDRILAGYGEPLVDARLVVQGGLRPVRSDLVELGGARLRQGLLELLRAEGVAGGMLESVLDVLVKHVDLRLLPATELARLARREPAKVVELLERELGGDPAHFEALEALSEQFTGTIGELLAVVRALGVDPARTEGVSSGRPVPTLGARHAVISDTPPTPRSRQDPP